MPYEIYKILHILGVSLVVMALGGAVVHVVNGGSKSSNAFRKGIAITHGVGLLFLLVAGFGMLAKLGIHSVPPWVIGKLVIWLILGAFPVLIYKSKAVACKSWLIIPALVVVASVLALYRGKFSGVAPAAPIPAPPVEVTAAPA